MPATEVNHSTVDDISLVADEVITAFFKWVEVPILTMLWDYPHTKSGTQAHFSSTMLCLSEIGWGIVFILWKVHNVFAKWF